MSRDRNVYCERSGYSSRGQISPPKRIATVGVQSKVEIELQNIEDFPTIQLKAADTPQVVAQNIITETKPLALVPIYAPFIPSNVQQKPTPKADIRKTRYASKPKIVQSNNIEKQLARTANKASLLDRAVKNSSKTAKKSGRFNDLFLSRFLVFTLTISILGFTGFISFNTWQTNIQAKQVINSLQK